MSEGVLSLEEFVNPEHRLRSSASIGFVLSVILVVDAEGQEAAREDGQWTMPAKDYAATRYMAERYWEIGNPPVWL